MRAGEGGNARNHDRAPFGAPGPRTDGPLGHVGVATDMPAGKITDSVGDDHPAEPAQIAVKPVGTPNHAPGPTNPAAATTAGRTLVSADTVARYRAAENAAWAIRPTGVRPDISAQRLAAIRAGLEHVAPAIVATELRNVAARIVAAAPTRPDPELARIVGRRDHERADGMRAAARIVLDYADELEGRRG